MSEFEYLAVSGIALLIDMPRFYRGLAWYLLIVTVAWAFGMRRLLI